ncbi:MAG: M42 family metallopeptidase [Clostridiaceae bacterium]|nr:M42 family metallopeptidase [Clostridiaceae bacterium]
MEKYLEYAVEQIEKLCKIPSPSGFTAKVQAYLIEELAFLGYTPKVTNKGSVLVNLGGEGHGLVLSAHVDTLGLMVRSIKSNGRLRFTHVGGFPGNYIETENCTVITRDGREYSGTIQIVNPAAHYRKDISETKRDDANMEIVLDEKVFTKEDVEALGIMPGDFVALDPRTIVTEKGFIKSRHLDDKAGSALLLALARYVKEENAELKRNTWLLFTMYEEVGHGACSGFPEGISEIISVDMGVVGEDLGADEFKVSICAKDSNGPYDYDITTRLIELAKKKNLQYAVDIYPFYGSDAGAALAAGHDFKHGLIGPGVAASHGYERTHKEGLLNALKLIKEYITNE